ncbi:hypothetical protein ACFQX7_30380 [Luedemannella flava]
MSVNWAKVEPAPGIVDEAAVAHTRRARPGALPGCACGCRCCTALPAWLAGEAASAPGFGERWRRW